MTPAEVAALTAVVELVKALGAWPLGALAAVALAGPYFLIVVLWWLDNRRMQKTVDHHQADVLAILTEHRAYMDQIKAQYEANVHLVQDRAEDHKQLNQIVKDNQISNAHLIKALTELGVSIRTNQFCPTARVEKRQVEVSANE
jgi:hypothetical protein